MLTGELAARVVITGIGVVSPFGVGRERFWEHVSRGCSGTRAITEFDASEFACRVAAPVPGVTHRRCAGARRRRHLGRATIAPIRSATRGRRWSASSPRARRGPTPGCASPSRAPASSSAAAAAASTSASGSTTTSSSSAASKVTPYAIPVVDRRHGVERDFDLAAAARHQPRAVVRLHQLDRRDRLRRGADRARAKPTCCCRAAPTRASRPA